MAARIAIAMAVYNDARHLERCLGSLARSSFRDFAVTIVDDGSTDDSIAVAERWAKELPITLRRAPHRGIGPTKREALEALDSASPFVMVLDADIVLAPDTLERMMAALERTQEAAVISARAVAEEPDLWGASLAFLERAFYGATSQGDEGHWIVGGCAIFRREALARSTITIEAGEDASLAEQLRRDWKLLCPTSLEVAHLGEPKNLADVVRRGVREGGRVAALHALHPGSVQVTSVARLVVLPLAVVASLGLLSGRRLLGGVAAFTLGAYAGAFLIAMRKVPGTLPARLGGTALFLVGNVGYGVGYLRERMTHAPGKAQNDGARAGA